MSVIERTGLNTHDAPEGTPCFPSWLEKSLAKEDGWQRRYVFDHLRHVGPIAFSEPYGAGNEDFAFLVKFCEKHGLRFSASGHSAHFPGQTFRLVIWRPQDDDKALGICCHVRVGKETK
jgi:hypothetical protein